MRSKILLVVCLCSATLSAEPKKILAAFQDADLLKELQSVSPDAHIVPVTGSNVMQEIADADGYVGAGITSARKCGPRRS